MRGDESETAETAGMRSLRWGGSQIPSQTTSCGGNRTVWNGGDGRNRPEHGVRRTSTREGQLGTHPDRWSAIVFPIGAESGTEGPVFSTRQSVRATGRGIEKYAPQLAGTATAQYPPSERPIRSGCEPSTWTDRSRLEGGSPAVDPYRKLSLWRCGDTC
jgi:hypothetical protein